MAELRVTRGAALAVVLCLGLGGCAKKRIPECDAFVKTIEKLASCPKVPDAQRITNLDSAKTIRDAHQKLIDEAGGIAEAPADLVSSMREACKTQDASLQQMYADCLR